MKVHFWALFLGVHITFFPYEQICLKCSLKLSPAYPHPREVCWGVSLPVAVYLVSRCSRASHSRTFMLTGMLTFDRLAQSTASFGWQRMLWALWKSFFQIEMASCCQWAGEDLCFHSRWDGVRHFELWMQAPLSYMQTRSQVLCLFLCFIYK